MNKFNQVRKQKNADDEQAEMFADTMDMIARERAVMNTSTEELHILHDGIKILIHDWQHSNEIDTELSKELQNPQNFSDYQDYIKHLLRLSKLETTIKVLANFKN